MTVVSNGSSLVARLEALSRLTRPQSIAVIGASPDVSKLAGRTVPNLLRYGFQGRIYPVNPSRQQLAGLRCFRSATDLPEVPDTAFVVVPAARVLPVLRDLETMGVPSATVVASGFGEDGTEEGQARGRQIVEFLRNSRLRLLGPNSIGTVDVASGAVQRATTNLPNRFTPGPIGVASQSGALSLILMHLLEREGLGVNQILPMGNEADLALPDAIEHLAALPGTRCVIVFIEAIRRPDEFARACASAQDREVSVIAILVGASALGRAVAQGHTGALATDYRLVHAYLRDLGVIVVPSPAEAVEVARLLVTAARQDRDGLVLICLSGGEAALLSNLAEEAGISLPQPSPAVAGELARHFRFSSPRNPFDVTADALSHPSLFETAYGALTADDRFRRITFMLPPLTSFDRDRIHPVIESVRARDSSVSMVQWPIAGEGRRPSHLFGSSDSFLHAYASVQEARQYARPEALITRARPPGIDLPVQPLSDEAVRALARQVGIPWCAEAWIDSDGDIPAACSTVPGAWVLKGSLSGVSHKTDWGGVMTDLRTVEEVREGLRALRVAAETRHPGTWLGAWLQNQAQGMEVYLGALRHARLGCFLAIGEGGIDVESNERVAFAPFPVDPEVVSRLIHDSGLDGMMEGSRGRPEIDPTGLQRMALALAALCEDPSIVVVDINPLFLARGTEPPVVVDMRMGIRAGAD